GPGGRLERHRVEPGDLGEDLLQAPLELERTLYAVLVLQRMEVREPGQLPEPLVDPRVVLHRAGAERVEARVDAEVARRQLGEVADELELGHLRKARRVGAPKLLRELAAREALVARDERRAPAGLRLLVDQIHAAVTSARTSASLSISSGVRFSVTLTSSTSSSPS